MGRKSEKGSDVLVNARLGVGFREVSFVAFVSSLIALVSVLTP